MEMLKKTLCVGLEKRADWKAKLTGTLDKVVTTVGLELGHEELARLAAIPDEVANLIYSGGLESFILEFAGETCEVLIEYYPAEDEQDDLDLSLLEVVDWEAESLLVRIVVENAEYAETITGPALMPFSSERLTIRLEQSDDEEGGLPDGESDEPPEKEDERERGDEERKEAD
jgi:hypothetical protein